MIRIITISLLLPAISIAQNLLAIPDTLSGPTYNLTLQTGTVQFFPGQLTNTFGANGNLLGPTLMMNRFDSITINVHNQLADTTTLHWHGMHVAPQNDGGPHITIAPNTVWSPSFMVRDHAGTHWYHPHMHEKTNDHVQMGIAGLIIVRDSEERGLTLPRTYGIDDIPVVLQTKAFDINNQIIIASALDSTMLVNGTRKPYKPVPAQMVRLRLLNGASERVFNLGFTNNRQFHQIATDGGLLTNPVALTRLRLAPGERAEILVNLAGLEGQTLYLRNFGTELPNAIYGAAQPGMGAGQTIPGYNQNPLNGANFDILRLDVVAPTNNPVTALPGQMTTHNPWPESAAYTTRQLVFNVMMGGGGGGGMGPLQGPFTINGAHFDMMTINYTIPFENIEIWELRNQTPISHPFHIHDVQFYILDINGVPPPAHMQGRKDVVLVPAGNSTVRFITRFETFHNDTLPYMYHCHMLTHEDHGMMGQFVVSSANVGISESAVFNRLNPVYPNPASSLLHVQLTSNRDANFQVVNQFGQVLMKGMLSQDSSSIDVSVLISGVYFIHVEGHDVQRFIKL